MADVFISYSRANRDFARNLYARLERAGFSLWRDVNDIEAGADDWWDAIKEGIENCDTLILCMSLPALKSPVVADEWFYARQLGKRVIPVVAGDIWDHPEVKGKSFTIPNWMQRRNWIDYRPDQPEADAAWENLLRTLRQPYTPKRFISMVDDLPPRFVRRPEDSDRAIAALVDDNNDAVAMTTALRGAGGYGKTTLAKAIARDVRIQGAFDDGILWVTLGEEMLSKQGDALTNALIGKVAELIDALTDERPVLESLEMAHSKLEAAIGERYILLVIDDVWDERHLKPFLVRCKHSACLITTRNADTVSRGDIHQQHVDKMKPLEAVELLGAGIDPEQVNPQRAALTIFARDLREYPLLLALANTTLANWMNDMRIPLVEALELAREAYHEGGVLGFDDQSATERSKAVDATLAVSLKQLLAHEATRYRELAIFAEDVAIPLSTLALYWGLSTVETLKFCQKLFRKTALLHSFEGKAIRLHDVFRDYLLRQHTPTALAALHTRLITAWGFDPSPAPPHRDGEGNSGGETASPVGTGYIPSLQPVTDRFGGEADPYAWRYAGYHLVAAGRAETLRDLLLDYRWLRAKLYATDLPALLDDCDRLPAERRLPLVRQTLTLSANALAVDADQLAAQLLARTIATADDPDIARLRAGTPNDAPLRPLNPERHLAQAGGAALAVFQGHTNGVLGALALSDGSLLSWSWDGTLRRWGLDGGERAVFQGHKGGFGGGVNGALALSDGSLLSWSNDGTLRRWGLDGGERAVFQGHTDTVRGALALSDGSLLSWSADGTLRRWGLDGGERAVFQGHTSYVNGALALSDGSLLSWSWDGTLRRWGLDGGERAVFQGHTSWVNGALALSDGSLLSWSGDGTLRRWGLDGGERAVFQGHTATVRGALALSDGSLLSWSSDGTLRRWGLDGGERAVFQGHTSYVNGALALADGSLLSWSLDDTLRRWGLDGGERAVFQGHKGGLGGGVNGALALSDGSLLSWSNDGTLRRWGLDGGAALAVFQGHTSSVNGALALSDGSLLSWSSDGTLRRWGLDGGERAVFQGHTSYVNGALALSDGSLLSWSSGGTLRRWGLDGGERAVFQGHTDTVRGALALADGSLLSWSSDGTLRRWGLDGGERAVFQGHTDTVRGALALADGSLLSWSLDDTLWRWGLDGGERAVFQGHTRIVNGALALSDGSLLSWSGDGTLRRWGLDGQELAVFQGHTGAVLGALALSDGSIVSWSADGTLRRWGLDGGERAVFQGHKGGLGGGVNGALALSDGSIVSWSGDGTLRRWTAEGQEVARLDESIQGDKTRIFAWAREQGFDANVLFEQADEPRVAGLRAFSRGDAVLLYDPADGRTVARFINDYRITCLAASTDGRTLAAGDEMGHVLFLRWAG